MKIAIDARWIFPSPSGIGVYTRELIRALAAEDGGPSYLLFFQNAELEAQTARQTGFNLNPRFSSAILPYGIFSPVNQLRLPDRLRREAIDLFHSPNYMIPLLAFPLRRRGGIACVVTLHDAIPLKFPDHAPRSRKRRLFFIFRWLMRQVGRRADAILTVSHTSQRDLAACLNFSPAEAGRIQVVYNGVNPIFKPTETRPDPANPTRRRNLLYVGRADPYKNLPNLIRGFADLVRQAPFPVHLTLAGARDPRYPEAPALARELGLDSRVTWVDRLEESQLVQAYQQADALVMPSRYEGFGLPVAEAMACGTPVVCGQCGALEEVAGRAGLFVNPEDPADLATTLLFLLTQPGFAAEKSRQGPLQAARFSWPATAQASRKVYEKAVRFRKGMAP
jgi:glycosyltransferase involved in cell wall biosynthesis